MAFVQDKYNKQPIVSNPKAYQDYVTNQLLNKQMLGTGGLPSDNVTVNQGQSRPDIQSTPVSGSMLENPKAGVPNVMPEITVKPTEDDKLKEAYNETLPEPPSEPPPEEKKEVAKEPSGFSKFLSGAGKALGSIKQSDLARIGAGLAAQQGNYDVGDAYLGTANRLGAEESAEADRQLRRDEAEAQRTYDWRKLKATLDAQAKKALAEGKEDPRKVLGYEGLAKHTAVRQGLDQVSKNIVPMAETKDGANTLRKAFSKTRFFRKADPEEAKIRTSYMNAAEAVIRSESGAAVPPEEIARLAKRFAPTEWDSDEQVKNKISTLHQRLKDMKNSTEELYQTGGEQGQPEPNKKDDPLGIL